jgi:hypothetical protein
MNANVVYDGVNCDARHWVDASRNLRSAPIFHDIVAAEVNGTKGVASPLFIQSPCKTGGYYYSDYLKFNLWRNVGRNNTLVIASEELEDEAESGSDASTIGSNKGPQRVLAKIRRLLFINNYTGYLSHDSLVSTSPTQKHIHRAVEAYKEESMDMLDAMVGNFTDIRINSQDHKGGTEAVPRTVYRRGVYAVSGYVPMFTETRALLDACWRRDCVFVSQVNI